MDRIEALKFLQLAQDASDIEIKKCLEDKLLHYENLSSTAPSDFLRRLNEQNLVKIKNIQKDFEQWTVAGAPATEPPGEESPVQEEKANIHLTAPVILSGTKSSIKKGLLVEPAAWLVRHIDNESSKLFPLFSGKTFLGRKSNAILKPFIVIDEDDFISRVHAVVFCEDGKPFDFYIDEPGASDNLKPSKNGIYINGNENRLQTKTKLKENDTIQIGVTKFILRVNHAAKPALIETEKNKFMDTVIVKLPR